MANETVTWRETIAQLADVTGRIVDLTSIQSALDSCEVKTPTGIEMLAGMHLKLQFSLFALNVLKRELDNLCEVHKQKFEAGQNATVERAPTDAGIRA